MTTLRTRLFELAICGFMPFALEQAAHAQLVVNGDFETTTSGGGQLGYNTTATGWSVPAPNGSYTFLFTPSSAGTSGTSADNGGVSGQYGNLQLWGPGNGSANGLTVSPTGGNFLASDGAFQVGAISQTIHNLTVGQTYQVGFYWGGAQQEVFNGATKDQWTVSLGGQSQSTALVSLPSHGFTGWMYQTFNFTADASSDVLSFLAYGEPSGVPPFALLDWMV